jgi:hypothetical protein
MQGVRKASSAIASVATPTQQAAGELKVKKTGNGLIEAPTSSRALASSGFLI